jgi:predicted membrane protein
MLLSILIALVLAGLILWAVTQFPLDPTVVKLIRVVVVVACVLYILGAFLGYPVGLGSWGEHRRSW